MFKRIGEVCIALTILLCGAAPAADWSVVEDDMKFMREEEKLARDVYATVFDYFGAQGLTLTVFDNIAQSEQRHMNAVKTLLDNFGIPDSASFIAGEEDYPNSCVDTQCLFKNDVLDALYEKLITDGKASPLAAFLVGALIEEADMTDLARAIADAEGYPDIQAVYANLLCGSGNHLRAFAWNIELKDPEYISYFASTAEYLADIRPDPVSDLEAYEAYVEAVEAVLTDSLEMCGTATGQGPAAGAPLARRYRGGR